LEINERKHYFLHRPISSLLSEKRRMDALEEVLWDFKSFSSADPGNFFRVAGDFFYATRYILQKNRE